jgi:hypothetical protein
MHDYNKYVRMKKRVVFVAHEVTSMLQNISQRRSNKAITLTDFNSALRGAYLSIYPGVSVYPSPIKNTIYHYGHFPMGVISCVRGRNNGNVDILWEKIRYIDSRVDLPLYSHNTRYTIPAPGSNIIPSRISPGFSLKPEEIKIVMEFALFFQNNSYYSFPHKSCNGVPPREAFGFYIVNPKGKGGTYDKTYFNTIIAFTPQPELFSATPI